MQLNAERVRTRAECSAMATDMSQLLDGAQAPIFSLGLAGEVYIYIYTYIYLDGAQAPIFSLGLAGEVGQRSGS